LESLYGGGPKKSPDLYDLSEKGQRDFPFGLYRGAASQKDSVHAGRFLSPRTEDRLAVNLLVEALTFRPAHFSRKLERSPCEN
jgi:hypothetical protein